MQVSVIVPVFNGASTLPACLSALQHSRHQPLECIVVDDGSTDHSARIAADHGATVIATAGTRGPARARNIGSRSARGDVLVFVDADVALHEDALGRMVARIEGEPSLDALIGAYDDSPADPGFVSSFKNLMHCFVHREANPKAFTFWCGCGAVRRGVFEQQGGFDESYRHPSIEDIEFGFRLLRSGGSLALDAKIQGKHLKKWTLRSLVITDVFSRGIPWTELILRTRFLPSDLNLRWSERLCVALSGLLAGMFGLAVWHALAGPRLVEPRLYWAALVAIPIVIGLLNHRFYAFLASRRGWRFSILALPLHILYYFYSGVSVVLGLGSYLLSTLPDAAQEANSRGKLRKTQKIDPNGSR